MFVDLPHSLGVVGHTLTLATPIQQEAVGSPVYVYFFWGDGCPHCAEAKPFLQDLAQRYPNVQIESFEVWCDAENQVLFQQMATAHDFDPQYVPSIFLGEKYWEGFNDTIRGEIEALTKVCVKTGCPDAGVNTVPGHEPSVEEPLGQYGINQFRGRIQSLLSVGVIHPHCPDLAYWFA